jgi:EAL domain-containing protein (putative c-di-GMP-specific phosphodiesterase class I)
VLSRCRARGISIALDDYGTHYSSLTYLRRLPIDTIKIDQSFVKEVPTSGSDSAIIRSVIALGHDLGKAIVAEGIETPDQLAWLRTTACDIGQGYLFARPMPPNEITPWKRKQTV